MVDESCENFNKEDIFGHWASNIIAKNTFGIIFGINNGYSPLD